MKKKTVLKLSPELGNGEHWAICDNKKMLIDCISAWWDNYEEYGGCGDFFIVEAIQMTQKEIDNMPII